MTDQERAEVCKLIQREADKLASHASRTLEQMWLANLTGRPAAETVPESAASRPDLPGKPDTAPKADELTAMLRDGFVRLGSVIALSVLVNEPGLITEDLLWLSRMFSARNISVGGDWTADLLRTYAAACADVLPAASCEPIRETIEAALARRTGTA